MNNSLYQNYYNYLSEEVVTPFYNNRLNSLNKLRLKDVLKRKNPYLFKAKNIELAGDLVKSIVDAFLSSQEETIFGNLLEGFAIYISQTLHNGFKSNFKSVDLEFERDGVYYIVGIKSGTSWANSDQITAMRNNFKVAKQNLKQKGITSEIIAVNGCMYGRETVHLKNNIDIAFPNHMRYIIAPSSLAGRGLGVGFLYLTQLRTAILIKLIINMLVKIFGILYLMTITLSRNNCTN